MSLDKIRVLIVDDSAFARKVIREVLERDSSIEVVGIARDGLDALEKIAELKPDVITLDLVMPDLDGLGVLKALPASSRTKVVVVSVSGSESDLVIEALHMGAIDVVTKPTASPTDRLYELSDELIRKVKSAHLAKVRDSNQFSTKPPSALIHSGLTKLIVLGTSTGGPQAITEIFKSLPGNLPVPLVIALHIPAGYTAPLAARVSKTSELKLIEAYEGMELLPNQAVIAPGGMHLIIHAVGEKLYASISEEPRESLYHPSVDLLFESAAKAVGDGVLGVVLTGMGNDGMRGSKAIRENGGRVITESSISCVVFGMPRSVLEAGDSNEEAPLENMAALIVKYLGNS